MVFIMTKFLNLDKEDDMKIWKNIISQGHGASLHTCPYQQDFVASEKCSHYEPCSDAEEDDLGECTFALISCEKCFCELQPMTKEKL